MLELSELKAGETDEAMITKSPVGRYDKILSHISRGRVAASDRAALALDIGETVLRLDEVVLPLDEAVSLHDADWSS